MKTVKDALATPGYHWRHESTAHAEIYVLDGSRAAVIAPELPERTENAVSDALAFLGEPFAGAKLQLLIVGKDSELVPIAGGLSFGQADPTHGSAFLVGNDSMKPQLRHELTHLLSWRLWGPTDQRWMIEGVATLVSRECGGYPIGAIASELNREGKLVPLDTLWDGFSIGWEQGVIDYVEAASLIDYVDRVYGPERVRALWRAKQHQQVRDILGVDRSALEAGWRSSLARVAPSAPWSNVFQSTVTIGCR